MQQTAQKHGTENRQKSGMIGFRVSPEERAEIEMAAAASGLTVGSFVREKLLKASTTRQTRKPALDLILLSKLLGQLGKIGGNLNQIAKRLNEGRGVGSERIVVVLSELSILKESILKALRREDDSKG